MTIQNLPCADLETTTSSEAAAQQQAAPYRTPPAASSGHPDEAAGAPPSNTAPANYITGYSGLQILRFGVDSLYLSYPGTLSQDWAQKLEALKAAARADEEQDQALAQVQIGEHVFEVLGKGRGRFAYVLVDNCFQISISATEAQSLPLAYVQVSSELLTSIGPQEAAAKLQYIINTLGTTPADPRLSRCDLFVDFLTEYDPASWHVAAWITRAHRIDSHHIQGNFSGWSIGLGGPMGARLYDKTKELDKSRKDYLKPLWLSAGWDGDKSVWRLEYQYNRDVLKELGILTLDDLSEKADSMWKYAMESWLRLTIPSSTDDNQTRWPTHPLWHSLSQLDWGNPDQPSLKRFRKSRIPSDESLFINGLGAFTSFMAREGITELDEGIGEYLAQAQRFHEHRKEQTGTGFHKYFRNKVSLKGKKYNTILNHDPDEEARLKQKAEAYRRQRDGE